MQTRSSAVLQQVINTEEAPSVPQQLLLNYKINEIHGNKGCIPRSSLLWLLFNTALTFLQPLTTKRTYSKGKAKDNVTVCPCWQHFPSGAGTVALNKAQDSSSLVGLDLSLGQIQASSQFAWVTPGGNTCPWILKTSCSRGYSFLPPWSNPRQAILVLSLQPLQPKAGLVNSMTLLYTSSKWAPSFLRHCAPD